MNSIIIKGPKIYIEQGILEESCLVIKDGVIKDIFLTDRLKDISDSQKFSFPSSYHLIPGMIDMHIHGAKGADIMDADFTALETIAAALPSEGTTAFLGSTMTETPENIEKALKTVNKYVNKPQKSGFSELLGINLEGPFISRKGKGAQCGNLTLPPNIDLFKRWQKLSGNLIKLVNVSPELDNALEFIQYLHKHNVIASIGHTDASYEETVAGIKAGATHATHLFNAMRKINQRAPATVTALLLDHRITAELIVDGIHVHPAIIKLAYISKGKEKIVLVTDAMRAKCLGNGNFTLGGQPVTVKDGKACLKDRTLAGSVLKMCNAAVNMMKFSDCDLNDIIMMSAQNPAKELRIFNRKGSIAKEKDADLVVLNEKYQVVLTLCRGTIAYQKE